MQIFEENYFGKIRRKNVTFLGFSLQRKKNEGSTKQQSLEIRVNIHLVSFIKYHIKIIYNGAYTCRCCCFMYITRKFLCYFLILHSSARIYLCIYVRFVFIRNKRENRQWHGRQRPERNIKFSYTSPQSGVHAVSRFL